MGLLIGLGGGNAGGGGGGVVAGGLIQDMDGVEWTGTAQITDKTITEFPVSDFRYCTSLANLFYQCKSLVSVGELKNTGKLTSASFMFYNCSSLQSVPAFDTANVTDMSSMFNFCSALQTVPLFDTAKVTNIRYMFGGCSSLQSVHLFDTAAVNDMSGMFNNCSSLQSVPAFDTANVTKISYMLRGCSALQSVAGINMINVTSEGNADYMFYGCTSIVTANIANLGVSLDLSWCKVLSIESVLFLFNNAKSGVSGKTIQLNSLVFDQLTEGQIAIATEKGFSVTSVVRS